MIFALLTVLATVALAFANCGNDVSKGVATHLGAGLRQGRGAVDWRTLGSFALAWVVILPVAAVFGGFAAWTPSVGS